LTNDPSFAAAPSQRAHRSGRTEVGPLSSCRAGACRGGFTLIELLVVVGIISILASISVPNFLEAQTRAKVARVLNDQRVLTGALETYHIDHSRYPPRQGYPASGRMLGDGQTRGRDLSVLSTPISYLSRLPVDLFENALAPPNNLLDYWDDSILRTQNRRNSESYALVSVGPDGYMGGGTSTMGRVPYAPELQYTFFYDYNPTNGTISAGNVYRFSSQRPAAEVFFSP